MSLGMAAWFSQAHARLRRSWMRPADAPVGGGFLQLPLQGPKIGVPARVVVPNPQPPAQVAGPPQQHDVALRHGGHRGHGHN